MVFLRAILGLAFFCGMAWLCSSHKRKIPWRVVGFGLLLQFLLGFLLLRTRGGQWVFRHAADFVLRLIGMAEPGAELVFGGIAKPTGPWGFVFAFAGTGLPVIIFFSALMAILYHLGIMQVIIYALARVMTALMGVSGAESMAMAANVFVGQTEAPLVVRPYIANMTMSELNALMTGGFATVAGSVLAVYIGLLGEEYGAHLLTASVMSAPAAFLIAKLMLPETEDSLTGNKVELRIERTAHNVIEAAANGTTEGLKLYLNVLAMLIAFVGLVHLIDWPLGAMGLSLAQIFGWVFAPVAWLMGVEGWHDCQLFGRLLGIKISLNEFLALKELETMLPGGAGTPFEHSRSAKMAAYALCGFANFASIGVQMGGISPLAPERKSDLAQLALRAMLGGAFASWMTATVAGVFID